MDDLTPIDMIRSISNFTDQNVHVLMAIARKKENEWMDANSDEIVFREVVSEHDEVSRKYYKLQTLMKEYPDSDVAADDITWRLYYSANPRDPIKAFFELHEYFIEWGKHGLYYGDMDQIGKISEIDSVWISTLQKPLCAADSRFVIDLDTTSQLGIDDVREQLSTLTTILKEVPTPNGQHFLTRPFNHQQIDRSMWDIEVKTDDPIFIERVGADD